MSGIVGLFHLDGSPVDCQLLDRMTAFLAFRGPDALQTWHDGNVGLGHALLRIAEESANESQPFSLDQQVWIVADARIDAREDLVRELAARGRTVPASAPDAELILHAYHAWGEDCLAHLLGDFCFAIWDARLRRLFCARDHFGVKSIYYACQGKRFLFSNSLRCMRSDPATSARLDDSAVGDLLLLGLNSDPSATAFAEIRRLPPAHALAVDEHGLRLRRYWTLPVEEEIRYRSEGQYVDEFRDVLARAVRDRVRAPRVALLMSGGLDSPSVAAVAAQSTHPARERLKAFTLFYEHLIPDEERHFAGLVAQSLQIPIQLLAADDNQLFHHYDDAALCPPEPHPEALMAPLRDLLDQVRTFSRALLTGQGGDPTLSSSVSHHARFLLRHGRLRHFLQDFGRFALAEGRLARLYLSTRWGVFRYRHKKPEGPPPWLNPEFSARFPYRERMARALEAAASPHPFRPHAHQALSSPMWPDQFASYDPDFTGVPVEFAHPYFDLRLVRFVLRLPAVPWCTDKEIVRLAMRGVLPDSIRLRRKSPLARDVIPILLQRENQWWQDLPAAPGIDRYIRWDRLPRPATVELDQSWPYVLAVGLNVWMTAQERTESPVACLSEHRL